MIIIFLSNLYVSDNFPYSIIYLPFCKSNIGTHKRLHYGDHYGHIMVLPSLLRMQINLLSTEEKELAKNCSQLNFTASASAALLNIRDALGMGIDLDDRQVSY